MHARRASSYHRHTGGLYDLFLFKKMCLGTHFVHEYLPFLSMRSLPPPWTVMFASSFFKGSQQCLMFTDLTVQAVCTSKKNQFIHGVMQNCRHDKRPSRNPWIQIFYDAWCKERILLQNHFVHFRMYASLDYVTYITFMYHHIFVKI